MPIRLCGVACALCFGHAVLGSIVNGGFEPTPGSDVPAYLTLGGGSTAINGWTTTDMGVEWFVPSAFGLTNSSNGGWVLDLASNSFFAGGVTQTFATDVNTSYRVDFEFASHRASGRDGTAEIVVSAAGTSQLFSISNSSSNTLWESRSFTFIATSTSTTLSFRNTQSAVEHFAYIDGVSMVPAPGAVHIGVLAGIGCLRRPRR